MELLICRKGMHFNAINVIRHPISKIRRQLFDLLVLGSFPDQFYRVGREVIRNKVDFIIFFLIHGNLSKQTVGREEKE